MTRSMQALTMDECMEKSRQLTDLPDGPVKGYIYHNGRWVPENSALLGDRVAGMLMQAVREYFEDTGHA